MAPPGVGDERVPAQHCFDCAAGAELDGDALSRELMRIRYGFVSATVTLDTYSEGWRLPYEAIPVDR